MAVIPSPCVGVCSIHPEYLICKGCARTRLQIAKWSQFSDDIKLSILEELKTKKEIFGDLSK